MLVECLPKHKNIFSIQNGLFNRLKTKNVHIPVMPINTDLFKDVYPINKITPIKFNNSL